MKLLLVEDAGGMRKLLIAMLKSIGFEDIVEAADGKAALEQLNKGPIDLLLTDWNMPRMTGIELVEKIRGDAAHKDLSILMFTGRSARQDVLRALQAGVDSYIAKPFTAQQLKTKIRFILDRSAAQRINHIVANLTSLERSLENPLILFGENAIVPERLKDPANRHILTFLANAVNSLEQLNATYPAELRIGYLLENSRSDITKRLRTFRHRIKMMMVDLDLPGGGLTLARLVGINRQSTLAVFILCQVRSEIPTQARHGLENLGIHIIERHALDEEAFAQLFNEYIFAPLRDGVIAEPPSSEEFQQRLEHDIQNMTNLPVLPQVYHRIVALDRDQESEIQQWIEAIEVDPLTRAQVIRRARSPIYGFRGKIDETDKAVILLGKTTVKDIIVSGALKRSFEKVGEKGFEIEDYWLHSIAVALIARLLNFSTDESAWTPEERQEFERFALDEPTVQLWKKLNLSERLSLKPAQDPFIGGLMHDIGKVALVHSYPGILPMILEEMENSAWKIPMRSAEETITGGIDHTAVGRILAKSWKLGDAFIQAIENHHQPGRQDTLSQLIAIADFLGGGILPYPRRAVFPMVGLLQQAKREQGQDPAAMEAVNAFLPEGLCEQLEISLAELIELGKRLMPAIHRKVEELQKSC